MGTEARNPRSIGLDAMSAREIVRLMNEEEHTVVRAMAAASEAIARAAERMAQCFQEGGRTVYVGAGTSGRVARMDAAEMPPTFGTQPNRVIALVAGGDGAMQQAIEDAEDNDTQAMHDVNDLDLEPKDILIALAASGRTNYVVTAARHASAKGIWTCGIANNPHTPLLEVVDLPILLDTGPEILTGSTRLKAGTSQKLALNAISTAAMVLSGKVVENLMVDVQAKNAKLKERCIRIVRELTNADDVEARRLLEQNNWNVREVITTLRPTLAR
ncbi:MAG: N-acetylmuramic acid 6-phosphate etherase [Fimbriimonadaceae bacterium]|nr:N-acetylmuramic acid 6-phosphate etherase [Fimbriimonadaceae bacterium]